MSSSPQSIQYDPRSIELKWQLEWERQAAFAVPRSVAGEDCFYVYSCTPFTTGRAHMGHVRSYTIADVCARRARMRGRRVLWAMGFDAFGLPNEIAAIRQSHDPSPWVRKCAAEMTTQFRRIGLSVDWSRSFVTSDPDYYRWTQWVFLRFLDLGLVYRAKGVQHWCEQCRTVLASMQVGTDGACWRCNGPTELISVAQWYLSFSKYRKELWDGLGTLEGWDETVLAFQRSLIGRIEGVEFSLDVPGCDATLNVFTPHPEAIDRATFIAVSPNDPAVEILVGMDRVASELTAQRVRAMRRSDRSADRIPVVDTGRRVSLPGLSQPLPIWITPAVDMKFGGGAALGIPSREPTDGALAAQLDWKPSVGSSGAFTGSLASASRYKLRDSCISRQRGWGAPVPIIHCDGCGLVPIPDDQLPVKLPADLRFSGAAAPLAAHPTFSKCVCPKCGTAATRDVDTLDVHFDSIWMLIPFCVPAGERESSMFAHPELRRWLPVGQVVCGADQAGWWVNDRLFFKALCDLGYFRWCAEREPVKKLLMHEMILADGRKMSKSAGNSVDPNLILEEYGADTLRLAVLKVNPRKAFNWNSAVASESHAFLRRVWSYSIELLDRCRAAEASEVSAQAGAVSLRRWIDAASKKIEAAYETDAYHLVLRELKTWLSKMQGFSATSTRGFRQGASCREQLLSGLRAFLEYLEPLAPHLCCELLSQLETSQAASRVRDQGLRTRDPTDCSQSGTTSFGYETAARGGTSSSRSTRQESTDSPT